MRKHGNCADKRDTRDGARKVAPTLLALDLETSGLANILDGFEARVDGRGVLCS
jgi:hypothetical protein